MNAVETRRALKRMIRGEIRRCRTAILAEDNHAALVEIHEVEKKIRRLANTLNRKMPGAPSAQNSARLPELQ